MKKVRNSWRIWLMISVLILKGQNMGKSCTANMRALDVRKIQRDGCLKPGRSLNWLWSRNGKPVANIDMQVETDRVTLIYQVRNNAGEPESMNYPVRLAWTACNYGGQRAWWLCPAAGCGRRVAVLYGGAVFACRHCQRLVYRSQNETPSNGVYRRADNLRDRLGWVPGVIHGAGSKPKGMHWQTFLRLLAIYNDHERQTMAGLAVKLDRLKGRLGRMGL